MGHGVNSTAQFQKEKKKKKVLELLSRYECHTYIRNHDVEIQAVFTDVTLWESWNVLPDFVKFLWTGMSVVCGIPYSTPPGWLWLLW